MSNQLKRLISDSVVGGVCSGLATRTGTAIWAWRVGTACLAVFGGFVPTLFIYCLLWACVPADDEEDNELSG